MEKKVSIIIPVYKSAAFLPKLLESVLNQSYKNLECILVDDGSPDNSGMICDDYKAKDSRVVVIHKENGGTCDARNKGLEIATGHYLMFADGDDWLSLDCVEYLVRIAEENDAEMSMSDCVFTTMDLTQNKRDNIRVMSPEEACCFILYAKTPVGPWNKLYTMDIVKKNNLSFSVPWFGEGLWFSSMASQLSNKVAVGHRKVYVYRKNNPNSGTAVRDVQNGINALHNIEYIKEKLVIDSKKTRRAADWHIWKNNFNLVMYIVGASAKKKFMSQFVEAKHNMRKLMLPCLLHANISFKFKMCTFCLTIFPVLGAHFALYNKKRKFNKDLKKLNY